MSEELLARAQGVTTRQLEEEADETLPIIVIV